MSLAINIDEVGAVLLVDGWHEVMDRSFEIDAYEVEYFCPLTAVLAVRYLPRKLKVPRQDA